MLKYCPETVTAAESFAKDITYIAVSSLGSGVEPDPTRGARDPAEEHPAALGDGPSALFDLAGLCRR